MNEGQTDVNGEEWNFSITGLAAHHESPECLHVMLDFGVDVNKQEREYGGTPLMESSSFGRVECMRTLLEKNADATFKLTDGRMALYQAVTKGHSQCVQLLIENNADVDCRTELGDTGLILAAWYGHPECVKVIMEAKADVNCEIHGTTVFTAAFEKKDSNSVMLLLDHGGGGTPASADTDEHALGAVLQNESRLRASEQLADSMLLARASAHTKSHALGVVLESEKGFPASEQAVAFMLLAHGADIDDAAERASKKRLRLALPMYEHIHRFIERWHGIASNALSVRVEVDRRVGLGLNGLYQEPLERVLQYLGLSMGVDQVVNMSIDDADGVQRALLPNCARNADHWFRLHQQNNEQAAAEHNDPEL
jgi:hypothetical protein